MNGRVNSKMYTIRAFLYKVRALLLIFKRSRWGLPSRPSCVPLNVAEYASISLNMSKHPWKWLNKLFWLCQGPEYAWIVLHDWQKMPRTLNKPLLWIWHACIGLRRVLNMSYQGSICLNNARVCLNMAEYCWICLKMLE